MIKYVHTHTRALTYSSPRKKFAEYMTCSRVVLQLFSILLLLLLLLLFTLVFHLTAQFLSIRETMSFFDCSEKKIMNERERDREIEIITDQEGTMSK